MKAAVIGLGLATIGLIVLVKRAKASSGIRLYGTVIDSQTGVGISGVDITVIKPLAKRVGIWNTDSEGNYEIVLEPGEYSVLAQKLYYDAAWVLGSFEDGHYIFELLENDTEVNPTMEPH